MRQGRGQELAVAVTTRLDSVAGRASSAASRGPPPDVGATATGHPELEFFFDQQVSTRPTPRPAPLTPQPHCAAFERLPGYQAR